MSSENEAKKRTIYVSGLDEDIKNYHLRVHFEQFGKVNDAHIIYDKLTRKSKGFGFVEFDVLEDYKRAFEHQNHVICGKQVEIKTHKINSNGPKVSSFRASDRLLKELKKLHELDACKNGDFTVELKDDSNIFEWHLKLFKFDDDSQLAKDLKQLEQATKQNYVLFHVVFNEKFPFEPPFVRLVLPWICGGYIQSGGALCMEILSKNGWSPAYTMESMIIQLSATLVNGGARISSYTPGSYSLEEARQSFENVMRIHSEWN